MGSRSIFRLASAGLLFCGIATAISPPALATWQHFGYEVGFYDLLMKSIFEDRSGTLWFAHVSTSAFTPSAGGVSSYDGIVWKHYRPNGGLFHASGFANAEDGGVWAATVEGLWKFNGGVWVQTAMPASWQGTVQPAICTTRSWDLWVGGTSLLRLRHGQWSEYSNLPVTTIRKIFEDREGRVWVGGVNGLAELRTTPSGDPTFVAYDSFSGLSVVDIAQDSQGTLWVSTNDGLERLKGNSAERVQPVGNAHLAVDRRGAIWMANDSGIWRYLANHMDLVEIPGLSGGPSYLFCDVSGNLWFSSSSQAIGIWRFDSAETRSFLPPFPPGPAFITSLYLDRSGNFWFTSAGWGVTSLGNGDFWTHFSTPDPLLTDYVYAAIEDRSGRLWLGHDTGMSRDSAGIWTQNGSIRGATSFAVDAAGNLYAAEEGIWSDTSPILRFNGAVWDTIPISGHAVVVDRQDRIWATQPLGVARMDSTGITGQPLEKVEGIAADSVAGVWVITSQFEDMRGGVYHLDPGWKPATNFPSEHPSCVMVDHLGRPWVGTNEGWLCRKDSTGWRTYDTSAGLPPKPVLVMGEDACGNIWSSGEGFLRRLTLDFVPPQTVFVQKPAAAVPISTVSVTARAAFDEAQGIEFSFRADSTGSWSPWSSLGAWDSPVLASGQAHFIEARSRDIDGNIDDTPAKAHFDVDTDPPAPIIASPRDTILSGMVSVTGTSFDPRFGCARLLLHPVSQPGTTIPLPGTECDSIPVTNGLLATWDTRLVGDGAYDLELLVTDSLGLSGSARTRIEIDNQYPPAVVTSPVQVISAKGGDVYTDAADFHLYFAPRSFGEDTRITLDRIPADSIPDPLPNGAHPIGDGFRIDWSPQATPRHAGRAERSLSGLPAAGALAMYRSSGGAPWARVGGTVSGSSIQLPITAPGTYAVFAEVGEASGVWSKIRFTPRVFSPQGNFADREVGISFSLPRAAPVTIRVFNRTGALIRELVDNEAMSAGENLIRWDGKDGGGTTVLDGIYVVTVKALGTTLKETLAVVH